VKLTPTTTLDEACRNPDGKTYNGAKLAQFLIYCTTGKQITDAEAHAIVEDAMKRRKK
jgi:hypothetical protein